MSNNPYDMIGRDIKMNFDMSDISTDKADLETVEGSENLAQAVLLRLRCPINALPLAPLFGSRLSQLMGKGQSKTNEYLAHLMIGEALMREARQVGVDNINVTFEDDVFNVSFRVIGIDGNTTNTINYSLRV